MGAVFFAMETYLVFNLTQQINYLFFLFFGTLIIYSLHRYIGLKEYKAKLTLRATKIRSFRPLSYALLIISITACIYLSFSLDYSNFLPLSLPILLSLLYILPVLPKNKRLRDYPFMKIFLIALVWTILCFSIPKSNYESKDIFLIVERFFFMLAITLPFDIRDINIDSRFGVKTIATELGEKKTVLLALLLLLSGFILLAIYYFQSNEAAYFLLRYLFVYTLTGFLIYSSSSTKQDYHFTGYLDGTLILRGLVFLL